MKSCVSSNTEKPCCAWATKRLDWSVRGVPVAQEVAALAGVRPVEVRLGEEAAQVQPGLVELVDPRVGLARAQAGQLYSGVGIAAVGPDQRAALGETPVGSGLEAPALDAVVALPEAVASEPRGRRVRDPGHSGRGGRSPDSRPRPRGPRPRRGPRTPSRCRSGAGPRPLRRGSRSAGRRTGRSPGCTDRSPPPRVTLVP